MGVLNQIVLFLKGATLLKLPRMCHTCHKMTVTGFLVNSKAASLKEMGGRWFCGFNCAEVGGEFK